MLIQVCFLLHGHKCFVTNGRSLYFFRLKHCTKVERVNTPHTGQFRESTPRKGHTRRGWKLVLVRQRRANCASFGALGLLSHPSDCRYSTFHRLIMPIYFLQLICELGVCCLKVYCRLRPLDNPNEPVCVRPLNSTTVQLIPPEVRWPIPHCPLLPPLLWLYWWKCFRNDALLWS